MALLEIITVPDHRLKKPSVAVEEVNDEIRQLADDMLETMYAAPGIGLAAVQVGVLKRVIVVDIAREEEDPDPLVLINPQIIWAGDELSEYEEGCLSVPEIYEKVERPSAIKLTYLDRDGNECEMECDGMLATCIQHEIDHTNGIVFIDYLTRLKRDRIVKKFIKAKKQSQVA